MSGATHAMSTLVVNTSTGTVLGNSSYGACTAAFFGIPYASPPTGQRRWRPPVLPTAWQGVRDARLDVHARCLQTPDAGTLNLPAWLERPIESLSGWKSMHKEDCLFVNVQTPATPMASSASALLPVLVDIHGGSYLSGSGSKLNASAICAAGVVFVSFNYRLGALGALALPSLLAEANTTGNYAIQDQRLALHWVQRNIAAFGGDPARVTISGESAGGMAVAAHLASPRSASLFAQAILMSGNDDSLYLDEATDAGARYAARVGCGPRSGASAPSSVQQLHCLRAADSWALINSQNAVYNGTMRTLQLPVSDGFELPHKTLLRDVYASGAPLPDPAPGSTRRLLAGTNVDDISLFLGFTSPELVRNLAGEPLETNESMWRALPRLLPSATHAQLSKVMELYEPSRWFGGDARRALYALGTDGYYHCPTRRVLDAMAATPRARARAVSHAGPRGRGDGAAGMAAEEARAGGSSFAYLYNGTITDLASALGLPESSRPVLGRYVTPWLGAFHTANTILFWGFDDPALNLTNSERALGSWMVDKWAAFVRTGTPSPEWPTWTTHQTATVEGASAGNESYLILDTGGEKRAGAGWHSARCAFLGGFRFVWNPPGT